MKRPDDETLMAYADGLLETKEREEIAAFLESDPEARETVAMFERTAAIVAGFGDEALNAPMPDGLIAMLRDGGPSLAANSAHDVAGDRSAPASAGGPATATVLQMRPRQRFTFSTAGQTMSRDLAAMAACLALVVGLTVGWLARPDRGANVDSTSIALGPVSSGSLLASLLEKRLSFQPLALPTASGEQIALVAMSTFRDQAERYCREFELTSGPEQRPLNVAVACRDSRGLWTVEGVAKTTVASDATPGKIKPAGVSEATALDGFMSMLGANPALSKDEEKAILERGWK